MSLDAHLEQARAAGTTDSPGRFTLALPDLLDRFSKSLLLEPQHAPLLMVAAAVHFEALSLSVESRSHELTFSFEVPEPILDDGVGLVGPTRQGKDGRWWAMAMATNQRPNSRISLACPGQKKELVLADRGFEVRPWQPPPGEGRVLIRQISTAGPLAGTEEGVLTRYCDLCPVEIRLSGRTLQRNLQESHRGWPTAWSESAPTLLRPQGQATLVTPMALFLARTGVPKPVWVVVIGGVSYPFLVPQAPGVVGVLWSADLRTDLGLKEVVRNEQWTTAYREIQRLATIFLEDQQI